MDFVGFGSAVRRSLDTMMNARKSVGIYSDPDDPLFRGQGVIFSIMQFLLRSGCLSVEVFIHGYFGKNYLTVPKLMAAIWLPAVCVYLAHFNFEPKATGSPVQPGFFAVVQPNAEVLADVLANEYKALQVEFAAQKEEQIRSLLEWAEKLRAESEQKIPQAESEAASGPLTERLMRLEKVRALKEEYDRRIASLRHQADEAIIAAEAGLEKKRQEAQKASEAEHKPSIYQRSIDFFKSLLHPTSRKTILIGLTTFFVGFSLVSNIHLLQIYFRALLESKIGLREPHPDSSGEPWPFLWPLYWVTNYCNAKTDLIKQFAEPALCYWAGSELHHGKVLPPSYSFVGTWLMVVSFLLFIRVYLENRKREKTYLDRIGSERNAEAFQLQNSLAGLNTDEDDTPVQVRGR